MYLLSTILMLYHDQMNEDMGGLGMALHCTEDGNVACMVNGAGLAMSTMDNFVDAIEHGQKRLAPRPQATERNYCWGPDL